MNHLSGNKPANMDTTSRTDREAPWGYPLVMDGSYRKTWDSKRPTQAGKQIDTDTTFKYHLVI